MKTKVLALVLAMLMLLSLVACNSGNGGGDQGTDADTTENTTSSTPNEEPTGNQDTVGEKDTVGEQNTTGEQGTGSDEPVWNMHLPQKTYDDTEFTILFRNNERYVNAIVIEQISSNATSVERAVYERMVLIEDTYKIKFNSEQANDDGTQMMTLLSGYSKTDTDQIDLFGAHAMNIPWTLAINGCLYEWGDLELIDLDAPYWSQNARENFSTPGGKIFFMTGDMSYLTVATAFCMFFNEDIIKNIDGLEMPYDLVRNDMWTFEEFEKYVMTTANNMNGDKTGHPKTDSLGYATASARGPVQIMVTTKDAVIEKDENSKTGYKVNAKKEALVNAVADFVELCKSGAAYYDFNVSYDILRPAFISNRLAFYDDEVDMAGTWTKEGVPFGVLPWPKYNEDVDGYNSLVNAGNDSFGLLINTSDENAERISVILENLAYYGRRDIIDFYYETILSYQYVGSEDSIEMLDYIHDGLVFDFGYYFNAAGVIQLAQTCCVSGQSLSTEYGKISGAVEDKLATWKALDD